MAADHYPLSDSALDQLFRQAHTHNKWTDKPVSETTLRALADLMKMAPTSYNCCPARIVFVASADAKERLIPLLSEGNKAKTKTAPVTAILGYDTEFYEKLPRLASEAARMAFVGKPAVIETAAFRNASLQGGYMILAARSLGLDCGPMSGFDNAAVDKTFFPDGKVKSNFICSLGYGDPSGVRPRAARLAFEEFCSIV